MFFLQKNNLIADNGDDQHSRFYVKDGIGTKEREAINLLRNETPRKITIYFRNSFCLSCSEISKELEKHKNTIYYHLNNMLKLGVIEPAEAVDEGYVFYLGYLRARTILKRKHVNNEVVYRLKSGPYWKLLVLYGDKLAKDEITKSLIDHLRINKLTKSPKKLYDLDAVVDEIEKALYELCPITFRA